MARIILLLLLFATTVLHAQKIEKYYDYKWEPVTEVSMARFYALIQKQDSLWRREDYFLREARLQMSGYYKDADCKIPHGEFYHFYNNGNIEYKGRYVNGKKFGTWLGFHENGMMSDSVNYNEMGWIMGTRLGWHSNGMMADSTIIHPDGSGVSIHWWDNGRPSAAGYYSKGKLQHGKWQYFHKNGELASIEIYHDGRIISKEHYDETGERSKDTTNKDHQAEFPGGMKAWQKYLYKKLYFPEQYQFTNGDQAVVVVRFAVNEDGTISEITVTAPLHPDFDRLAVDAIRSSPKWKPAVSHNRNIKEYRTQPVTFAR